MTFTAACIIGAIFGILAFVIIVLMRMLDRAYDKLNKARQREIDIAVGVGDRLDSSKEEILEFLIKCMDRAKRETIEGMLP